MQWTEGIFSSNTIKLSMVSCLFIVDSIWPTLGLLYDQQTKGVHGYTIEKCMISTWSQPLISKGKSQTCISLNALSSVSTWSLSRISRNRLVHAINGNSMNHNSERKNGKRVKDFATSSFMVTNRTKLTRALTKLCHPRGVIWCPKKYSDRFDGKAAGMSNFIVFWWRNKKTASLAWKRSGCG